MSHSRIDDREGIDGGSEGISAKEKNGGGGWFYAESMTVYGGVDIGLWFCFMVCCVKNKMGSECRVSVRVHLVLGCTGSYGNTS